MEASLMHQKHLPWIALHCQDTISTMLRFLCWLLCGVLYTEKWRNVQGKELRRCAPFPETSEALPIPYFRSSWSTSDFDFLNDFSPFCCSLEYAYEPAEAFYEFVLGVGNNSQPLANAECPYSVLGLGKGASTSQVLTDFIHSHLEKRIARAEQPSIPSVFVLIDVTVLIFVYESKFQDRESSLRYEGSELPRWDCTWWTTINRFTLFWSTSTSY